MLGEHSNHCSTSPAISACKKAEHPRLYGRAESEKMVEQDSDSVGCHSLRSISIQKFELQVRT